MPAELPHWLVPSVLDRLLDAEDEPSAAAPGTSSRQWLAALERDLSDLLNTRCADGDELNHLPLARRSVLRYGLPDLASTELDTQAQRDDFARRLAETVARHEPRLTDVRAVWLAPPPGSLPDRVRYRIEARLQPEPAQRVSFEAVLDLRATQIDVEATPS